MATGTIEQDRRITMSWKLRRKHWRGNSRGGNLKFYAETDAELETEARRGIPDASPIRGLGLQLLKISATRGVYW
jgi:hypothetical protein